MTDAVWALHVPRTLDEINLHLEMLETAGLLGMTEEDGRATIYLTERVEVPWQEAAWERVEPRDWNTAWKAGFDPVTVGDVAVVAPWHPQDTGARITLVIEPAQAFGTGHHETTTACLAALQDLDLQGLSVLDVGTGTGVLALAAKALGAGDVVGVDNDPLATEAATLNAARNGLAVDVVHGSVPVPGSRQFDVVIANIDTVTLAGLARDLVRHLAPGGVFIGSGVSNERSDEAVEALSAAGLAVRAGAGLEWSLLRGLRT